MHTVPSVSCDRCGSPRSYITLKGSNGMIAVDFDLCKLCFKDVESLLLNRNRRNVRTEETEYD